MSHISQLPLIQVKLQNQTILFFSLLSLGGLPPFLGFLPKWVILQLRMTFSFYFLALVIITSSLFTLYFYLRLMFSAFIFGGVKITQEKCAPTSFFSNFLLSLSLGGLSLIYFLQNFKLTKLKTFKVLNKKIFLNSMRKKGCPIKRFAILIFLLNYSSLNLVRGKTPYLNLQFNAYISAT